MNVEFHLSTAAALSTGVRCHGYRTSNKIERGIGVRLLFDLHGKKSVSWCGDDLADFLQEKQEEHIIEMTPGPCIVLHAGILLQK